MKKYDYDTVIDLYEQGKSTQEIADELKASLRTIQRYVKEYKGEYEVEDDDELELSEDSDDMLDLGTIELTHSGKGLFFSDTHFPFSDVKYINWLKKIYKREKCSYIVFGGDATDQHTLSVHPRSARAEGTYTEYLKAKEMLKKLFDTFKGVDIYYCVGNHDDRLTKLASNSGIPSEFIKSFRELFNFPDNVKIASNFIINNVLFTHGSEFGSRNSITSVTSFTHMSTVLGHAHTNFGVFYTNSGYGKQIYCMYCGCLINKNTYAFEYAKKHKYKPVLGCGVVVNDKEAYCIPYTE